MTWADSGPARLLYVAPVAVIALLALWVRSASRPGSTALGCPDGCATVGERREGPLRVMSLNMLHGFPRFQHLSTRLDIIAEEIRRQDADIVCLQEVPWTPHMRNAAQYLAQRTELNYLYLRANGNRRAILFEEGEAILSRYALREATFTELQPQAGFFEHRVVLGATAMTPWGDIRVFVTHLTNGDREVNQGQAQALMDFVTQCGEGPAIVAGDFNATPDAPQIQGISTQWLDAFGLLHPDDEAFTCCVEDLSSGPEEPLEARIDYIFLAPGGQHVLKPASTRRILDQALPVTGDWQWASDHVGLLTELVVERSDEGGG